MFKHPRCGGQHSTVAEARLCEQAPAGTRSLTSIKVMGSPKHTAAQSAVLEQLRSHGQRAALRGYGLATSTTTSSFNQDAADRGTITREQADRYDRNEARRDGYSINAPRTGYRREATPPARKYLVDLLAKRDWRELETLGWKCEHMQRMLTRPEYTPGYDETSEMIEALKTCPYKQAAPTSAPTSPAPQGSTGRVDYRALRALKAQVPDGRYAVDLPGGDKVKFFALRTRPNSQYFTITHHVSDGRFPWATSRYTEVLEAILAAGVQAAGKRYAEEYGKCYNCGRALTDTDNPYKVHGLGPDCGPKVMG